MNTNVLIAMHTQQLCIYTRTLSNTPISPFEYASLPTARTNSSDMLIHYVPTTNSNLTSVTALASSNTSTHLGSGKSSFMLASVQKTPYGTPFTRESLVSASRTRENVSSDWCIWIPVSTATLIAYMRIPEFYVRFVILLFHIDGPRDGRDHVEEHAVANADAHAANHLGRAVCLAAAVRQENLSLHICRGGCFF